MRNFYLLLIFFSIYSFAQQPGKKGELLKNEMNSEHIAKIKRNKFEKNYRVPKNQETYRWNYQLGNSEVFIRIPERGRFKIELNDQMISNTNGNFRFFDLVSGNSYLSIYHNEALLYRTRIDIAPNSRMILDFYSDNGLYLLDIFPIERNPYGVNEWDDLWNRPYDNFWGKDRIQLTYSVMNDQEFERYLTTIQKESFDDNKATFIHYSSEGAYFTANQIKEIVKLLSFDDNRLNLAIFLYPKCVDRYNYYIVEDAFSFSSDKDKLREIINKHR